MLPKDGHFSGSRNSRIGLGLLFTWFFFSLTFFSIWMFVGFEKIYCIVYLYTYILFLYLKKIHSRHSLFLSKYANAILLCYNVIKEKKTIIWFKIKWIDIFSVITDCQGELPHKDNHVIFYFVEFDFEHQRNLPYHFSKITIYDLNKVNLIYFIQIKIATKPVMCSYIDFSTIVTACFTIIIMHACSIVANMAIPLMNGGCKILYAATAWQFTLNSFEVVKFIVIH